MPSKESLDVLIARKAEKFAVQVRKQAGFASKEEEIRIAVEQQLAFIQKESGIELEGNNNAHYVVTDAQWTALIELCAQLSFWGHFDSQKIIPHNAVHETTCPGHVAEKIDTLRTAVHDRKVALIEAHP